MVFWVNEFAWTYDPRETPSSIPFLLFPRQAEFLEWLCDREVVQQDGVAEKCRDVGFTWLCSAFAAHRWLFREGFRCGFGSRKLELVDKIGDHKCIFEKIRFLLRNLPYWMLPQGFTWKVHDNFCKLINPANGSTISGEGGDEIGRGDRATMYFVDEAAFLEHPDRVDAALSQTTRCRIDVSTPNGLGNSFARKRFSGQYEIFTFRWQDDPRKDEAWYAGQKAKLDPVILAQEVDIDYSASVEGVVIPAKFVLAAVNLKLPDNPSVIGPVSAGLDVAGGGKNKSVFVTRRGPQVKAITSWSELGPTQTAYRAADLAREHGVDAVYFDVSGIGLSVQEAFQSSEKCLTFQPHAINGGESPSLEVWPDGRTSQELFLNRRAELYWKLRMRFQRSYEFVEHSIAHAPEDMISIPNHQTLIAELSMPLAVRTATGKIKIESKEDMRKRGITSPDHADALAYSEAASAGDWSSALLDETQAEEHIPASRRQMSGW